MKNDPYKGKIKTFFFLTDVWQGGYNSNVAHVPTLRQYPVLNIAVIFMTHYTSLGSISVPQFIESDLVVLQ